MGNQLLRHEIWRLQISMSLHWRDRQHCSGNNFPLPLIWMLVPSHSIPVSTNEKNIRRGDLLRLFHEESCKDENTMDINSDRDVPGANINGPAIWKRHLFSRSVDQGSLRGMKLRRICYFHPARSMYKMAGRPNFRIADETHTPCVCRPDMYCLLH